MCLSRSRLFGFVRFHEDGARTKALLGKVRQPRAGARSRSRGPAPRSPRSPRGRAGPGRRSLCGERGPRGFRANCFLPPLPGYLAGSPAKSPSAWSWRSGERRASGPSRSGSAELPLLQLLRGSDRRSPRGPLRVQGSRMRARSPRFPTSSPPWFLLLPCRWAVSGYPPASRGSGLAGRPASRRGKLHVVRGGEEFARGR